MSKVKLKNCPFCQSRKTTRTCHGEFQTVNCLSCFATGPQAETEIEAIKLWNKRLRAEKTMKQLKTKAHAIAQLYAKLEKTDEYGGAVCCYCGEMVSWDKMNACHWIPKGNGAATKTSTDSRNIWPGHEMCNNLNDSRYFTMMITTLFNKDIIEELEQGKTKTLERDDLAEFIKRTRED